MQQDTLKVTWMDTGWNISVNGNAYENRRLSSFRFRSLEAGNQIELERRLPDDVEYHAIEFVASYVVISMYVEGNTEPFYTYGEEQYSGNIMVGGGTHWVELPPDSGGKNIRIELLVTEDDAFSILEPIKLAKSVDIVREFVKGNLLTFYICVFMISFGLVLLCITMFLVNYYAAFWRMSYVAEFSILVGLWMMCNYSLIQLSSRNVAVNTVLEYAFLYHTSIPIIFFYRNLYGDNPRHRRILNVQASVNILFAEGALLLQLTNVMHITKTLTFYHLLLVVEVCTAFYISARNYGRENVEGKLVVDGTIGLGAFIFFDVLRYLFLRYLGIAWLENYSSLIPIGVLVFIVCLIISSVRHLEENLVVRKEQALLERLAYEDYLTGINNRARSEMILEEMEEEDIDYAIASMDLNDLKKINDSKGHEAGDQYIKQFAREMQLFWKNYGTVGRMGGDEFIVILRDKKLSEMEALLKDFDEYMKIENRKDGKFYISVSYGAAAALKGSKRTPKEVYQMADLKMYEMKSRYHRGKQRIRRNPQE